MNRQDTERLSIPDESVVEIKETHISYVILTEAHAYKIKKPVHFTFLDFSTLEKRFFYCQEELKLNRRLCPAIYLGVMEIRDDGRLLTMGGDAGVIVDYAVKMKRIPEQYQMDMLLSGQLVTEEHISALAQKLAAFHREAQIIEGEDDLTKRRENFNDILVLHSTSGVQRRFIDEAVQVSDAFLTKYEEVFKGRSNTGMIRDCHGDLHAGNIFLTDEPIIFDCIEFKPAFRYLDILDELAFFCMDLEARNAYPYVGVFLREYRAAFPLPFKGKGSDALFLYYHLYRANVRAKVHALRGQQWGDHESPAIVLRYLQLMHQYALQVSRHFL